MTNATSIIPYLCAKDAARAIDFYKQAFGALETSRITDDDGRIGHAELLIGGARVFVSDEYPEIGVLSPATVGGSPVMVVIEVENVDVLFNQAVAAGAKVDRPLINRFDGALRNGKLIDPFGHRWMLSTRLADSSAPTPVRGYVLEEGQGVADGDSSTKASRESTGGSLTLIESHTDGGAPLHVHTREDEFFYVVDGAITVRCGDEEYEAGPRSFVFLPRGIPHEWDVIGGQTAIVLMMTSPAGLEEFLGEYHAAPTAKAHDEVAARYGITFIRTPAHDSSNGSTQ
jgi:PhnB protein